MCSVSKKCEQLRFTRRKRFSRLEGRCQMTVCASHANGIYSNPKWNFYLILFIFFVRTWVLRASLHLHDPWHFVCFKLNLCESSNESQHWKKKCLTKCYWFTATTMATKTTYKSSLKSFIARAFRISFKKWGRDKNMYFFFLHILLCTRILYQCVLATVGYRPGDWCVVLLEPEIWQNYRRKTYKHQTRVWNCSVYLDDTHILNNRAVYAVNFIHFILLFDYKRNETYFGRALIVIWFRCCVRVSSMRHPHNSNIHTYTAM